MASLSSGYRNGTSESAKRHERMRAANIKFMEERKSRTTPTFAEQCDIAKADETVRLLVKEIVAGNRAGATDPVAYDALRDRLQEIGVPVPDDGYFSMLFSVIAVSLTN